MATDADLGFGVLFKTDDGTGNFVTLAEVNDVNPPGMSRDSVEVTHELSPNAWREFIAGLKDGGEVSLELNFVPGGSAIAAMMAEFALESSEATKNRQVNFPDGSYFAFAAFLTGNEPAAPIDDKMALSLTFKVTGEPVLYQA